MEQSRCDAKSLWRTLTFTMNYDQLDHLCAGPGWSLQNDIHGYLVIAGVFALTHRFTYDNNSSNNNADTIQQKRFLRHKQLFWWALYAYSVLSMLSTRPFAHQWLSGEALARYFQSARLGLDSYGNAHPHI